MANGQFLAYLPTCARSTCCRGSRLRIHGDAPIASERDERLRAGGRRPGARRLGRALCRAPELDRAHRARRVGRLRDHRRRRSSALLAFVFQLVYLVLVRMARGRQLKHLDQPTPTIRSAACCSPSRATSADRGGRRGRRAAHLRGRAARGSELERFQAFLRLAVAAGPLLGLIGTVVGMIITFQSITESGSSDPKLMATGIGQAMIATVLGLGIAIPLLFANALLDVAVAAGRADPRRAERRPAGREHREAAPCLSNFSLACRHRRRDLVDGRRAVRVLHLLCAASLHVDARRSSATGTSRAILPKRGASETAREWQARTDHMSWCARQIRQAMISRLNGGDDAEPARSCRCSCRCRRCSA